MSCISGRQASVFTRLRRLTPWRAHSQLGRLLSAVVALLLALLVGGAAPAFAEDVAVGTTTTDQAATAATDTGTSGTSGTSGTGATTSTDTSTTTSTTKSGSPTAPATKTTTSTSGGTTTDPTADPTLAGPTTAQSPVDALAAQTLAVAQALATPLSDTAGFEIDGDTIVGNNGGSDWTDADLATESYRDAQGYQGTNKQEDDPSVWSGAQVATEKMDIVKLWVKTLSDGPRGVFGIQRDAANGTTAYSFEYNQRPNLPGDVAKPDRRPNDVMFTFTQSGNSEGNKLSFEQGYVYVLTSNATAWNDACFQVKSSSPAGGWCPLSTDNGVFYGATSDGSGEGAEGTYAEGIFAEGIVDFSKLNFPPGTCRGALGTLNVRSQASLEWTSALQDFAVADVNVAPTCGSLTIVKKGLTGDADVPGAIYSVVDDPRPGETGTLRIFDGTDAQLAAVNASDTPAPAGTIADGTADGIVTVPAAEPGTYTVTELRAPAGYLLPADTDEQVVVGAAGSSNANAEVTFRDPEQWQPLTARKTAAGSYDTHYAWTIGKGVRTGSDAYAATARTDSANASESFDYEVSIGEGPETRSDYHVAGAITVSNPNSAPVLATIAESLDGCTYYADAAHTQEVTDGSGAAGFQVPVPADDGGPGTPYYYDCPTTDDSPTSNTATVSVGRDDYPTQQSDVGAAGSYDAAVTPGAGNTLSPSIAWTATNTDGTRTIEVTDVLQGTSTTHTGSGAPWTHTWGDTSDPAWDSAAGKFVHTYSAPVTVAAGRCGTVTNTATITDTGQSAEATATHCRGADLTVSKVATESLTRTYPWKITKTASTDRVDVDPETGKADVDFDVRVQADGAATDSDWHMSGTITVTNPNDWEDVALTSLTDAYDGGGTCTIDGWDTMTAAERTIPRRAEGHDGVKTFGYTCTFASKPSYSGTNTATAGWDAAGASTPTPGGTASGTATVTTAQWTLDKEVNKTVLVKDDKGTATTSDDVTIGGPFTWTSGFDQTITYTLEDLTAPGGQCQVWTNNAWLTGDADVTVAGPAHDSVQVCNPEGLSGSKTATPSFTRTHHWSILKEVRVSPDRPWQDAKASWTGDAYSHDFDYRLTVSRDGSTDSAYGVSGSISVTNPNQDSDIAPIEATVTEPATFGGVAATCVIDDSDPTTTDGASATVTLASGEHADLDYSCTLAGKPADDTANRATISWGDDESTHATSDPISFTIPTTRVNEKVSVRDDLATIDPADDRTFGLLDWDDATTPVTYGPYTVDHTATATGCAGNSWTNTARVIGDDSLVLDSDTAVAEICPEAATWTVAKSSSPADGARIEPGTDITYTLTVTHTGGVPAEDVTVVDDLSDVLADATYGGLDPDSTAEAGNVTAPSADNGQKLTWDVGTLTGTETLEFVVHVKSDSWSEVLHNTVTSPGSANCPAADAELPAECVTDHTTTNQPMLTLVKDVDHNGTGATDLPSAWNLTADGPTDVTVKSGTVSAVDPGTYALSEDDGPGAGTYQQLGWKCGDDTDYRETATITLTSDQSVTCTVYNKAVRPRLTLVKDVAGNAATGGTAVPTDWTLSADGPDTDLSGDSGSADVTGAAVQIGSYDLAEAPKSTTPSGYTDGTTWQCVRTGTETPATMSDGDTVSLALADDVTCTITNTAQAPTWEVSKSSDPGDGATVEPGDTITYTLTARKTGGVDPTNVVLDDDLSEVYPYTGAAFAVTPSVGTASVQTIDGKPTMVWTIPSLSADQTLTYKVTVDPDAAGVAIHNVVTSPGSSNCPPPALAALAATEDVESCSTTHPVPAWTLAKSADPASGELVSADQQVTYTLTVENTSEAVLEGATVVDHLNGVLGNAVLDEESFLVDLDGDGPQSGAAPAAGDVVFDDTPGAEKLTWKVPTITPGDPEVTLSYVVTVNPTFDFGTTLVNVSAPGSAVDHPVNGTGACVDLVPAVDECSTHHGTAQVVEPPPPNPPHPPKPPVVSPPQAGPPPSHGVLPNTGGPTAWYLTSGVLLLLSGLGLALVARRRRTGPER